MYIIKKAPVLHFLLKSILLHIRRIRDYVILKLRRNYP